MVASEFLDGDQAVAAIAKDRLAVQAPEGEEARGALDLDAAQLLEVVGIADAARLQRASERADEQTDLQQIDRRGGMWMAALRVSVVLGRPTAQRGMTTQARVLVGTGTPPRLRGGWHAGLARSASLVPAVCGGLVLSGGTWKPAPRVSVVLGRPTAQRAMTTQARVLVGTGTPPRLRGGWHAGLALRASLVPVVCGGLVLSVGAWKPALRVSVVLGRSTAQRAMNTQASTGLRPACHPALRAGFALRARAPAAEDGGEVRPVDDSIRVRVGLRIDAAVRAPDRKHRREICTIDNPVRYDIA